MRQAVTDEKSAIETDCFTTASHISMTYSRAAAVCAVTVGLLGGFQCLSAQEPPFFNDAHAHDIWLSVDPQDWATLKRDYLLNTHYSAQFTFNEHTIPRVSIRSRGSGSRSPEKPNLLITFDRYDGSVRLFGLSAIILKANNQDPSMLREMLAMGLLRRMGVPAPREAPARLYVNGEYFGAYTIVERIDSAFLRDRFGESSGYLYEWEARRDERGYRFEYLGPEPENYSPVLWSPSNNESNPDPRPIVELTTLINLASDEDFAAHIVDYLDVDQFLRFIATENLVADFDGFLGTVFGMNNFYAYRFTGTDRFIFIPWDKDYAFDWEYKPIFEGVPENVLARRLLSFAPWRQAYLGYLQQAATLAGGNEGWMASEIERLYNLTAEHAAAELHKQCTVLSVMIPCGAADFEREVERLRRFAGARTPWIFGETAAAGYSAADLPQMRQ